MIKKGSSSKKSSKYFSIFERNHRLAAEKPYYGIKLQKMKRNGLLIVGFTIAFALGFGAKSLLDRQPGRLSSAAGQAAETVAQADTNLKLGAFSISLSVNDLKTSQEFYEKLGFVHFAGERSKNYLIMKNGNALIGLFQGMFENNLLTFNPGWDENAVNLEKFDDIRVIQQRLKAKGIFPLTEIDENTSGPAGFMITDPDGNVILIDQHR